MERAINTFKKDESNDIIAYIDDLNAIYFAGAATATDRSLRELQLVN